MEKLGPQASSLPSPLSSLFNLERKERKERERTAVSKHWETRTRAMLRSTEGWLRVEGGGLCIGTCT